MNFLHIFFVPVQKNVFFVFSYSVFDVFRTGRKQVQKVHFVIFFVGGEKNHKKLMLWQRMTTLPYTAHAKTQRCHTLSLTGKVLTIERWTRTIGKIDRVIYCASLYVQGSSLYKNKSLSEHTNSTAVSLIVNRTSSLKSAITCPCLSYDRWVGNKASFLSGGVARLVNQNVIIRSWICLNGVRLIT